MIPSSSCANVPRSIPSCGLRPFLKSPSQLQLQQLPVSDLAPGSAQVVLVSVVVPVATVALAQTSVIVPTLAYVCNQMPAVVVSTVIAPLAAALSAAAMVPVPVSASPLALALKP